MWDACWMSVCVRMCVPMCVSLGYTLSEQKSSSYVPQPGQRPHGFPNTELGSRSWAGAAGGHPLMCLNHD